MNALRLAMLAAKTPQKQTAEVSKSIGFHQQIYIYIYHYNAIIYIWKTIKKKCSVRTGLDMFFVRYVFFPNTSINR